MSIYINSNDYITGYAYNGRFILNKQISGQFIVQDYHFDDIISNWCNTSNNELYCYPSFNDDDFSGMKITFGNISSSRPVDIISWFETAFVQLTTAWTGLTCAVTYDFLTDVYTITFNHAVFFGVLLPSEVEFGDPEEIGSTIATLFNWPPEGEGLLPNSENESLNPHAVFYISGKNFGVPNYLEVLCPQIKGRIYTSKSNNPSFLITTKDTKILNQKIRIQSLTNYLDLKVYKPGYVSSEDYELPNTYEIILKPA